MDYIEFRNALTQCRLNAIRQSESLKGFEGTEAILDGDERFTVYISMLFASIANKLPKDQQAWLLRNLVDSFPVVKK
jgi:hypothetical protein